jgi:hypothetical protein
MLAPAATNLLCTAESKSKDGEADDPEVFRRYTPGLTSWTKGTSPGRTVLEAKISPTPQPSRAPRDPITRNSRGLGRESSLTQPEIG